MRRVTTMVLLAGVGGCTLLPGTGVPVPDLVGRVDFGSARKTQTTVNEIGVAANVSLINAQTNQTVSSAITNANGQFTLSFRTWKPTPGEVYYLEAVKGLSQNQAGNSVARVRTLGQWKATGWLFMTPGQITLTAGTTAVSIVTSHLGTASVPVSGLIGKLTVGMPDTSLMPTTKDTFDSTGTGITNAQYHKVYELVEQALGMDTDPVERIVRVDDTFALKAATGAGFAIAPTLYTIVPNAAPVGAQVTLYGKDFAGPKADNSVFFGTVSASLISSDPNQLVVQVPVGATSGNVTVRTGGMTGAAIPFTVTATDPTDVGGTVAPQ